MVVIFVCDFPLHFLPSGVDLVGPSYEGALIWQRLGRSSTKGIWCLVVVGIEGIWRVDGGSRYAGISKMIPPWYSGRIPETTVVSSNAFVHNL